MNTEFHIRERITTVLFLLICVLIGITIYFSVEVNKRWDELMFTYQHPQLVLAVSERYASGSAELEKNLLKQEQTAQDKLIEAVAEEVKVSK